MEFTAEVILPGKLAHIIIIILFLIIIRSSQCKTKTSSVEKKKNVYKNNVLIDGNVEKIYTCLY